MLKWLGELSTVAEWKYEGSGRESHTKPAGWLLRW